jgi:hypothetical protein
MADSWKEACVHKQDTPSGSSRSNRLAKNVGLPCLDGKSRRAAACRRARSTYRQSSLTALALSFITDSNEVCFLM